MLPKISHMFRLVKDVDSRFTPDGMQVCSLYLVASEKYKEKEKQIWIGATAFGKTAEFIANIKKGQRVFVNGKLQTDEWTNQQGEKQSRITMIIDSFEYVEKRDSGAQTQDNAPQQAPAQAPQTGHPQVTSSAPDFDDDIPF